jgi:hypothetical protein
MDKELFFEGQNWFKNTGYGEVSFKKSHLFKKGGII